MTRSSFAAVALAFVALLLTSSPHGHSKGQIDDIDCVLCHAQRTPAIESQTTNPVPDFTFALFCDDLVDGEDHDAAIGRHPARAPPA